MKVNCSVHEERMYCHNTSFFKLKSLKGFLEVLPFVKLFIVLIELAEEERSPAAVLRQIN